jgi:DNA-binding PadR family transcriptional regulator
VIDLAILGLLKEQELHGYELKKRLTGLLGGRTGLSFGSLYPALNRLERSGAVRAVEVSAAGAAVPMTGSLGGEVAAYRARRALPARTKRNRKVYAVTETGEARLLELLNAPAHDEREFLVQVAFCRFLPPDARLTLFRRRREELATRAATGPEIGRDRYLRSVRERDTQTIANDIAWLDRLIDDELRGEPGHRGPERGGPAPTDEHDPALPGGHR